MSRLLKASLTLLLKVTVQTAQNIANSSAFSTLLLVSFPG